MCNYILTLYVIDKTRIYSLAHTTFMFMKLIFRLRLRAPIVGFYRFQLDVVRLDLR